jgi:hypothetical protein
MENDFSPFVSYEMRRRTPPGSFGKLPKAIVTRTVFFSQALIAPGSLLLSTRRGGW